MKSEILMKLLEERLSRKINQLELRNTNHIHEISICFNVVDGLNSKIFFITEIFKFSDNQIIIEKKYDINEKSEYHINMQNSTSKEFHPQVPGRHINKNINVSKENKSSKDRNKNLSQDKSVFNPNSSIILAKKHRNESQKIPNLRNKKDSQERRAANDISTINNKSIYIHEGDENHMDVKHFNKYSSQKSIKSRTDKKSAMNESKVIKDKGKSLSSLKNSETESQKVITNAFKIDKDGTANMDSDKLLRSIDHSLIDKTIVLDKVLNNQDPKTDIIITPIDNPIVNEKTSSISQNFLLEKINMISCFLSKRDLIKVSTLNTDYLRASRLVFRQKVEKEITCFNDKLTSLNEKSNSTEINKEIPPFVISRGTMKAIELLNDSLYLKLFLKTTTPIADILWAYQLFFQLIENTINIKSESEFWGECCKFFNSESSGQLGELINNSIKNMVFTEENIYKVYKMCEGKQNRINPSYYSKICGTTGLVVFLIRDALEYCGIIVDKRTPIARLKRFYSFGIDKCNQNLNKVLSLIK